MLEKKHVEYHSYTGFTEDQSNENILKILLEELNKQEEEGSSEEEEKPKQTKLFKYDLSDEEQERKPRKPKKIAPEYVFVLDDMAKLMRTTTVSKLLKTNRHYKSKVICSSQYITDLEPESILQLDYCIAFKNIPQDKLMSLHQKLDLATPLDKFIQIYNYATKDKYNFLYIDTREEQYRKNFNELIEY
jgi:hypothetical protein